MEIIKDKQVVNSDWFYVEDGCELNENQNVTVSFDRWVTENKQLINRSGKVGVRIRPADDIQRLAGALDSVELIELEFPGFGDGRLFSHARLLRSRLGFKGEIRAVGQFLPDQVYFLHRVGVNAFQLNDPQQIPLALACFEDFTVTKQSSYI